MTYGFGFMGRLSRILAAGRPGEGESTPMGALDDTKPAAADLKPAALETKPAVLETKPAARDPKALAAAAQAFAERARTRLSAIAA